MEDRLRDRIRNHHLYKRTVKNKYLTIFLFLIIILITYSYFSGGFIYDIANQDLNEILSFINSFGSLSLLIYVLIIIIEIVIAPIPSLILNIAGSVSFGPLTASLLTIMGSSIGNTISYFIAKRYGNLYFERFINEKNKARFHKYSGKYGPLFLFILRLNPITSSDIFSYLAGVIGIPFKKFFISTMLGVIPSIFVISYFGETFVKNNPFLLLLFFIITIVYISILLYLFLRFGKNKVKARLKKF